MTTLRRFTLIVLVLLLLGTTVQAQQMSSNQIKLDACFYSLGHNAVTNWLDRYVAPVIGVVLIVAFWGVVLVVLGALAAEGWRALRATPEREALRAENATLRRELEALRDARDASSRSA